MVTLAPADLAVIIGYFGVVLAIGFLTGRGGGGGVELGLIGVSSGGGARDHRRGGGAAAARSSHGGADDRFAPQRQFRHRGRALRVLARRKGRSPFIWGLLAFFFSLIPLIVIALMPSRRVV